MAKVAEKAKEEQEIEKKDSLENTRNTRQKKTSQQAQKLKAPPTMVTKVREYNVMNNVLNDIDNNKYTIKVNGDKSSSY